MVLSTLLQNRVVLSLLHQSCLILALFLSPQNLVVLSYSLQNRVAPYLLQRRIVYSLFTSEPRGLLSIYFGAAWSTALYGCGA